MAKKANQFVRSHLQAKILFNTGVAGAQSVDIGHARVQEFSADHDYGTQPVHGVGDYEPAEHVHLKFQGTLTVDAFMIRKRDLVALGLAALGSKILEQGVLEFQVYDPDTKAALRVYTGVAISRYTERVRAGEICGENATAFFQHVMHDAKAYGETNTAPDPTATLPATAPTGTTTAGPADNPGGAAPAA